MSSSTPLSPSSPSSPSSPLPSLLSSFRSIWLKSESIIYRDFPRLAQRISIQTEREGNIIIRGKKQGEEGNVSNSLESIINIIQCLAIQLESKEINEKIQLFINDIHANQQMKGEGQGEREGEQENKGHIVPMDTDTCLRSLLSFLSPSSPLLSILRCIHQSMLVPAMSHIRSDRFAAAGILKDVRTEEGWLIDICLLKGNISITHKRKEESLERVGEGTGTGTEAQFNISWELRLSFDGDMKDMRAGLIRFKEITLNPLCSKEKKEEITEIFKGGELIL